MVDESHVSIPQIGGMYNGDLARKKTLVNFGFRLPSALDNRPQSFAEFQSITGQTLYVSATPAPFELERSTVIAEQVIRPTGLLDPEITLRPTKGQVEDLIGECRQAVEQGERVLVTTLTKRLSEDLTAFMRESKLRVEYLHSDIDALERVEILRNLRQGNFDVLIGINLLREGLDLPEVALVAVLDADKEGFLRSATSLMQTAGRAARHEKGRVIFYADVVTGSIRRTVDEVTRRRAKQLAYNAEHGITPRSVKRGVQASLHTYDGSGLERAVAVGESDDDVAAVIAELEEEMQAAANKLEFERAALLRDQVNALKSGRAAIAGQERLVSAETHEGGGSCRCNAPRTLRNLLGLRVGPVVALPALVHDAQPYLAQVEKPRQGIGTVAQCDRGRGDVGLPESGHSQIQFVQCAFKETDGEGVVAHLQGLDRLQGVFAAAVKQGLQ
jgi:excinuclease ABC subunit B